MPKLQNTICVRRYNFVCLHQSLIALVMLIGSFSSPEIPVTSSRGLSPKKSHEIKRLAAFLHDLASQLTKAECKVAEDVVFVDVGSGLGYLGKLWTNATWHLPTAVLS